MTSAGASWSPWSLSYLYARAIAADRADLAPLSGQALVVLARAISAEAIKTSLVPPPSAPAGRITDPHLFAPMSLGRLIEKRLEPAIAIIELVNPAFGYAPANGEPGFHDYCLLMDALAVGGATPVDVLADPQLREQVDRAADGWSILLTEARSAVMGAVVQALPMQGDLHTTMAPLLATLTPVVDDLLRSRTNGQ